MLRRTRHKHSRWPEVHIDKVIQTRRQSLALQVMDDSRLVVRAPYGVSRKEIESIVRNKQAWVFRKQQEARLKYAGAITFEEGRRFWFLGNRYPLHLGPGESASLGFTGDSFMMAAQSALDGWAVFERWYRKQAHEIFPERALRFSKLSGLAFKRLSITGARTRWGSCGPAKTLNFSWRLVQAPLTVVDYVVAHEIAHLEIRDHSRRFWEKVAVLKPDYRECRRWLRQHQSCLRFSPHGKENAGEERMKKA